MSYVIIFIVYFFIISIFYFLLIESPQRRKKYKKLTSDALILKTYYKLDLKEIGYSKVYRYLNITNSLLISLLSIFAVSVENFIIRILLIVILIIPVIWFGYYVLAKILEGGNKNV